MSKKINNVAMGQLLEGLTSSAVSPVSESSDSTTISEVETPAKRSTRIVLKVFVQRQTERCAFAHH